jgi:hypothetical protein
MTCGRRFAYQGRFRELPVSHKHQSKDAIVAQLPYPRWNDRQGNRLRDMATRRVEDDNRP